MDICSIPIDRRKNTMFLMLVRNVTLRSYAYYIYTNISKYISTMPSCTRKCVCFREKKTIHENYNILYY